MPKWVRIWVRFGAVVVLSGIYLSFFGVQTFFILKAHQMARKVPTVAILPVELTELDVSKASGKKLSYLGYEFEIPWEDIDEKESHIAGNEVLIPFHSGNSILLHVVPAQDLIKELPLDQRRSRELFQQLHGEEVLNSDYALRKAILETTPGRITLLTSREDARSLSMVLAIKAMMAPLRDSVIYSIRSNDFQGFQFGAPQRRPKKMAVELYADDGELEFDFSQKQEGPTPAIAQAEINRIIQTTRKAPESR